MDRNAIILLMAGSFLPNNLAIWAVKRIGQKLKKEQKHMRLISPKKYYAKFESDPNTQYRYHKKMSMFWLQNFIPMNLLVAADIWATLNSNDKVSLLTTAIILAINTNYSLYANFDTETGDAHAAYASMRADEIRASEEHKAIQDRQVTVEPAVPLHLEPAYENA